MPREDPPYLNIALASSQVGASVQQNISAVSAMVKQAAGDGVQVVCFPECALGGLFEIDDYTAARAFAVEIPGHITAEITELARGNSLYIAIGLLELEGSRLYDSAVLINNMGEIILKHRRINRRWRDPHVSEERYGEGCQFRTVRTPFGRIGLAICGDAGDTKVMSLIRGSTPDILIVPRSASFGDFTYDQARWDREKVWACDQALKIGTTMLFTNAFEELGHGGAYGGAMVVSRQGQILKETEIGKPSILTYQLPMP